ncbi:MAG: glycosyltransferase [Flavobacteriales bacterium]|nr:glycosyltransferase [Flavobacteriales bacterium]
MTNLKFSVLISVYRGENPEYFQKALKSVFEQSLMPDEVVLVKDGPLTPELDKEVSSFQLKYSELKIVSLKDNVGLGVALSKGLDACTNEIVARMDTDDICDESRFRKQTNFLINNPNIDLVGSNISEFNTNHEQPVSYRKLPEASEAIYNFGKRRNPINHMTVMFRKTSIEKVGGYLPFMGFEDYYLWVRMFVSGMKLYNIQEDLVCARVGNDMIGRRKGYEYMKAEIKLFKEFNNLGYLSNKEYKTVLPVRLLVRVLPKKVLSLIYDKFLRN